MKQLNKDNRGFSLVEIIIVVAILSIMGGVVGYSFTLTNARPAEQCAKRLAGAISHGRTATMGKYRNVITIQKDTEGRLTVTENVYSNEDAILNGVPSQTRSSVVGDKGVEVHYKIGTGSFSEFGDTTVIELRYDSGSGAMKKTAPGDEYYTGFHISKAGKDWEVQLEMLTGRVTYVQAAPLPEP